MLLNQLKESLGNISIEGVLDIITNPRRTLSPNYCHFKVQQAIINGNVSNENYVLLLGHGKFVAHSVICNDVGDILVDSYKHHFIDRENGIFNYDIKGVIKRYEVLYSIQISKIKQLIKNNTVNK